MKNVLNFLTGALECWRCLPLVNLELGWSVNRYNGFEADFELEQLRSIVELLPNLRRIRALIKWETIIHLTSEDFRPCRSQSSRPLCIVSDFYLPEAQQEGAERLARYLSILRPSAPVVCESYRAYFYRSHYNSQYARVVLKVGFRRDTHYSRTTNLIIIWRRMEAQFRGCQFIHIYEKYSGFGSYTCLVRKP
ncbi:hypothetical protein OPQ81_003542 [Rhizoctonia solani]|nr:hypothetical protein OPQ81_003542 [Rhizoctonia solani]